MTTYKLDAAIAKLALYGFTRLSVNSSAREENRLVTLHQDYERDGREKAVIRLARGRYKGNNIGAAWRQ